MLGAGAHHFNLYAIPITGRQAASVLKSVAPISFALRAEQAFDAS
jgi:hypothetical protein